MNRARSRDYSFLSKDREISTRNRIVLRIFSVPLGTNTTQKRVSGNMDSDSAIVGYDRLNNWDSNNWASRDRRVWFEVRLSLNCPKSRSISPEFSRFDPISQPQSACCTSKSISPFKRWIVRHVRATRDWFEHFFIIFSIKCTFLRKIYSFRVEKVIFLSRVCTMAVIVWYRSINRDKRIDNHPS